MSLPANFAGMPGEEIHRSYRNICIEFKKMIKNSTNIDELQEQMIRFINASKQMDWGRKETGVYHKNNGEKACDKVWNEFKRYIMALATQNKEANPQDLYDALSEVERLVDSLKVR